MVSLAGLTGTAGHAPEAGANTSVYSSAASGYGLSLANSQASSASRTACASIAASSASGHVAFRDQPPPEPGGRVGMHSRLDLARGDVRHRVVAGVSPEAVRP